MSRRKFERRSSRKGGNLENTKKKQLTTRSLLSLEAQTRLPRLSAQARDGGQGTQRKIPLRVF